MAEGQDMSPPGDARLSAASRALDVLHQLHRDTGEGYCMVCPERYPCTTILEVEALTAERDTLHAALVEAIDSLDAANRRDPFGRVITDRLRAALGRAWPRRGGWMMTDERLLSESDLLMNAWEVIANAGDGRGGWDAESPEWVEAASRWRERWHRYLHQARVNRD